MSEHTADYDVACRVEAGACLRHTANNPTCVLNRLSEAWESGFLACLDEAHQVSDNPYRTRVIPPAVGDAS